VQRFIANPELIIQMSKNIPHVIYIGETKERYYTLRDSLTNFIKTPFRRFSGSPNRFIRRISMHRYEVIIYWSEEDNAYIAEVPELPGCMADGATYEEALKNAQVIIDEWIETAKSLRRKIPEPKGKLMYA